VAVTARPALDAQKLRSEFPIFEQKIHGKPLAYLDSAASSQKPRQVLDALREFYETSYANVHRGVYLLSERATEAYEGAREKARAFVNAPAAREMIFTRSATESINLVAYAWGLDNLGPGDVVIVTELEHHSNFVPWQYIAKRTGATLKLVPVDDGGELDLSVLDGIAMDLDRQRYATFEDLKEYCYRVASAVGLICVEIFGYQDPGTRQYAIDLGIALQLTNIVRDVQTDLRRGRIYLPADDLYRFECSESDLAAGIVTPHIIDLLAFQCRRARMYYEKAESELPRCDRRNLLAARIMGAIYYWVFAGPVIG
jgi:hypothetical protein